MTLRADCLNLVQRQIMVRSGCSKLHVCFSRSTKFLGAVPGAAVSWFCHVSVTEASHMAPLKAAILFL